MARMRKLVDELARRRPDLEDPADAIASGRVAVRGSIVTNPASLVSGGDPIVVREPTDLRGSLKLRAALDRFGVDPGGRVCVDVGAAAGGFTTVLLERGARRVYAVDAGYGQLLGSLRQDPRVRNLEATNVAGLGQRLVPEPVGLVTVDVSYLSLSSAVEQLAALRFVPGAELVGLVKPMFELRLARAPTDGPSLAEAVEQAVQRVGAAGWRVVGTMGGVAGAGGAVEGFVHARRAVEARREEGG